MKLRSPSSTRTGITVAAALAIAALAGVVCRPQPGSEAAVTRGIAPVATVLGPFRIGEAVHYRAHLKLGLELGRGSRPQQIDITGSWIATPTDIHDGVAEVLCMFADADVTIDAHGDAASGRGAAAAQTGEQARAAREIAGALTAPLFLSYRAGGTIANLWFPRGTNPAIANLEMTLVGVQQLERGQPGQPAWVSEERDMTGRYLAEYRETGPGQFTRRKTRYLEASSLVDTSGSDLHSGAGDERLTPSIQIERSEFALRADPGGRLLEVRGAERLVFDLGSPALAMRTCVEIELGDAQVVQAPDAIGAFARARSSLEAQPLEQMAGDPKADAARRDRALLGDAGFDDLRAALRGLPDTGAPDATQIAPLRRRFTAAFRLSPAAAALAPGLVRDELPSRGQVVVDALSLARTAPARSALAAIATDRAAPGRTRENAVQYLAQDAPTSDIIDAVVALLDDDDAALRQVTRLCYGAFAHSLRSTAPESARRIAQDLLGRLERATAPAERTELIAAIGNTGAREALPALRPLIDTGAMRDRAQAVEALRFIDDPTVAPLLTDLLRGSPEEPIRLAAVAAIRFQDAGPYARVLADAARHDPAAAVRAAAVSLLGDRLSTLPMLRSVLEEVQRTDSAARNRELAARYLPHPAALVIGAGENHSK